MNTRDKCIEIIQSILNSNDLTFSEGGRLDYLSSVDLEKGIIKLPILQETFLILYELDDGKRLSLFFYIILMMENEEYELCEELLSLLEEKGMPNCNNSAALYYCILTMQLFNTLHECGHYIFFKDPAQKEILYDFVNKMGQEVAQVKSIDEVYVDEYSKRVSTIHPKAGSVSKELMSKIDYSIINEKFIGCSNNIEESAADLFALVKLDNYYQKEKEGKEFLLIKRAIMEAVYSISSLVTYKRTLLLVGDYCDDEGNFAEESYLKTITNPENGISVDQERFYMLTLLIDNAYDEYPLNHFELYYDIYTKLFRGISSDDPLIIKCLDAWIAGNNNPTDTSRSDVLYNRIMEYADSLKSLYSTN